MFAVTILILEYTETHRVVSPCVHSLLQFNICELHLHNTRILCRMAVGVEWGEGGVQHEGPDLLHGNNLEKY